MKQDNQPKKINLVLWSGLVVLAVLGGLVFRVIAQDLSVSLSSAKYSTSLKKTEALIKNFNTDLFNSPVFRSLEHSITLPLRVGNQGKDNPFFQPQTEEDLFLENLNQSL